jgi:hypothetical protein
MVRCPYCKERIRKGAIRCKHCHSSIGTNTDSSDVNDGNVGYLRSAFAKINTECDAIEDRITARTGFVFTKHQYSEDELFEVAGRIESFVEKISDDLERWEATKKLSNDVKLAFNRKVGELYHRLEMMHTKIQLRNPTWWEKVCVVFKRIISKLLPFLSFRLIAGNKAPEEIAA